MERPSEQTLSEEEIKFVRDHLLKLKEAETKAKKGPNIISRYLNVISNYLRSRKEPPDIADRDKIYR